jgi:hypothetical protein
MTFQSSLDRSEHSAERATLTRPGSKSQGFKPQSFFSQAAMIIALVGAVLVAGTTSTNARPVPKGKGGDKAQPQRFIRQTNTFSNMSFYVTNRGVLFNRDNVAGLYWPRGSSDAYIFGGGVWFATKKVIAGRRQKLAEIGYNPNSGAGWFTEGEYFPAGQEVNDGSNFDSKYITYFSPRYDNITGRYIGGNNPAVPPPAYNWPIWDAPREDDSTAARELRKNYYFGDYISNVNDRNAEALVSPLPGGRTPAPAILSQEDIVSIYSDWDVQQNPEYKPNRGYPFFLNIQEVIYSWSFGRYRDMIFIRHNIKNAGKDTLFDCYVAPAFDPDLGPDGATSARNDRNAYMSIPTMRGEDTNTAKAALRTADYDGRFGGKLENLNMAYQFSEREAGRNYGMIGFAFLESPRVNANGEIIQNNEAGFLDASELGLTTFKKWTINNDPPTQDLRYDFVSAGTRDPDTGPGDVRLLFSTGPFTLPPGKAAETVVGIGIAHVSTTADQPNLDSLIKLMAQAHRVFSTVDSFFVGVDTTQEPDVDVYQKFTTHFEAPKPPDLPELTAQGLDRAVLLTWKPDSSIDERANGLPFMGYELWRSTRSDLDSSIRPDGKNPVIRLGKWSLYDLRQDTLYDEENRFAGFRYRRINSVPNEIPYSFLDVGDDNQDGVISGDEGLLNGVRYHYYLVAFDEYDSVNNIGPLYTAVVKDANFVSAVPQKPPFVNTTLNLAAVLTENCLANKGVDTIRLDVTDEGRFQSLYVNDVINVEIQPRWVELVSPLYATRLDYYFDITDTRGNLRLTYDELYDPNATPVVNPYGEFTGLTARVPGGLDSTWRRRFTSDQSTFAPNQQVDQTFRLLVDYNMKRLNEKYHIKSVRVEGADPGIVRLSVRSKKKGGKLPDLTNLHIDSTRPIPMGSLGKATYEVTFGQPENLNEREYDVDLKEYRTITSFEAEGVTFNPRPLPVTVRSVTHCNAQLKPIRDAYTNDVEKVVGPEFYLDSTEQNGNWFALYTDPDTMNVPIAGRFAMDAWHVVYDDGLTPSEGIQFAKTTGAYYYPNDMEGNANSGKRIAAAHRLRLAGGEFILNASGALTPGKGITGDDAPNHAPYGNDFGPGDKLIIEFGGLAENIPFPDTAFQIITTPSEVRFSNDALYTENVLNQIQVVPNPYIVTHSGQTSTDNAKLFFTRLPPRATIQVYNIAGDLIKTLEHDAYATTAPEDIENAERTGYNSMLEWNLLSEGRQRIGSQVLTARIQAKNQAGAVIGEVIKKFAVVIGGYRIVR